MKITKYILIVVIIICLPLFYLLFGWGGHNRDPRYLYSQTPEFKKVKARHTNCSFVNDCIRRYYSINKKYVKNISELNKITTEDFLLDPLTNRVSEFEVCDSKNPDKWYRTKTDPYEPVLPLWNPSENDGIYQVRHPKHPEEEKVLKHMKSMMPNEYGINPEDAERLRQKKAQQKENNK